MAGAGSTSFWNPQAFSPTYLEDSEKSYAMGDSKFDATSSHRRSLEKAFVMEFDDGEVAAAACAAGRKKFFKWWLTKKQWWSAVIGCILLVVLVLLLVLFLTVVPGIFQSNIDKVKLTLNYMDIKSMSSDETSNKMDVELSIRVDVDASVSSTMDDAPATLYYLDKPFSSVTLPSQKIKSGRNSFDLVIRNVADITDVDVFHALSKALVTEKNVLVAARAAVKAHAMGLSAGGLKLNREFNIKAFQQFADPKPEFNNINLSECTETAYKMLINVTLDNVAQVGIGGIGALNLSVYYEQGYLGQAISTNATLGIPRGPTPMVLELTITKGIKVMAALAGMLQGILALNAQFYVTGNHALATKAILLQDALAQLNMSMPYKDGLTKVTLNPNCDLISLLSATTSTEGPTAAVSANGTETTSTNVTALTSK